MIKSSSILFKFNINRSILSILLLTATLGCASPGHAYDPSITADPSGQDMTTPTAQPRYEPSWQEKTYNYLNDLMQPDQAPAVYPDPQTGQPVPVTPNNQRVPRGFMGVRG